MRQIHPKAEYAQMYASNCAFFLTQMVKNAQTNGQKNKSVEKILKNFQKSIGAQCQSSS